MRRYATVIAVVLGLVLSGGHLAPAYTASTIPEQSYGGEPLKGATTVAPKQPAVNVAKSAEAEAASAEDAAAALVTGFTAAAENSSPEVTAVMKPVLEKTDAGQFYQDVPWIPDPNDESGPSKSQPAAQAMPVMPSNKGGGSPPAKEVEVDYYASTQPKKPEEPPTVAAVQKDCSQPSKPAAGYGTSMPAPATPPPPKEYSPAAPAAVSVQPSSPATATPAAASSSKPPSNDPYSPASSNTPATEQKDGLNEKSISDIVKEHNMFRAREHVPPIEWNSTLAKYAQEYAEQRRGDCQLEHSHGPYGENMMFGTGKEWTWKKTVDEWSDEKKSYDYKSNSCKGGQMCTHYTAVVWKNTTGVGCGRVVCSSGDTIMVCSYWPPGNYVGVKPY